MTNRPLIVPVTLCFAMAVVGASRAEDDTPPGARNAAITKVPAEFSKSLGSGIAGSARTPAANYAEPAAREVSHSSASPLGGARSATPPEAIFSTNSPLTSSNSRAPVDPAGLPQGRAVTPPKS